MNPHSVSSLDRQQSSVQVGWVRDYSSFTWRISCVTLCLHSGVAAQPTSNSNNKEGSPAHLSTLDFMNREEFGRRHQASQAPIAMVHGCRCLPVIEIPASDMESGSSALETSAQSGN